MKHVNCQSTLSQKICKICTYTNVGSWPARPMPSPSPRPLAEESAFDLQLSQLVLQASTWPCAACVTRCCRAAAAPCAGAPHTLESLA